MRPSILAGGIGLALAAASLAAPAPTGASSPDGLWQLVPPPAARAQHGAVYDPARARMVVVAGRLGSSGAALDEVWTLALSGPPLWEKVSTQGTPPSARYAHTVVYDSARDRLLVMGGYDGSVFLNDVWALSLDDFTWTALTPSGTPPSVRWGHVASYDPIGDRMIVFGGQTTFGSLLNDAWQLSLAGTPAWSLLSPTGTKPSARRGSAAAFDPARNQLVVFGGVGPGFLADVWTLTLSATPAWALATPTGAPPAGRGFHSASFDAAGDRIVFVGGTTGSYVNDAWSYSLAGGGAWSALTPAGTPPAGRGSHSAVFDPAGNRLVLFAGASANYYSDLWELNLAGSTSWAPLPASSAAMPAPRSTPAAILDPVRHRLLAFGGNNGGVYYNDVWVLPLQAGQTWVNLAPTGTPPASRRGATAVYDALRDRVLVFGGSTGSFPPNNDVWALTLSGTPAWTQLTPSGTPPAGRVAHAAVYDPVRDRMVVYGGVNGNWLADAWELTLAGTPAWNQLAPSGTAPTGRSDFSAIYDAARDRLVFWGGQREPTQIPPFDDGAAWALNFAGGGSWQMLTASGAPAVGYGCAAAYDAAHDRMLMFGGSQAGGANMAGSQLWEFALAGSGSWRQMSPAGVLPPGRIGAAGLFDPTQHAFMVFAGFRNQTTTYWGDVWSLYGDEVLAVTPHATTLSLALAGPNPSHGGPLTLSFTLPTAGHATLRVYDVTGRAVRTVLDGQLGAGAHTARWDGLTAAGTRAGAGLYFCELRAGGERASRRMVLVP